MPYCLLPSVSVFCQVTLTANALDPFSVELVHQRSASRMSDLSLSFALAMIDFMEWDLQREANRLSQKAVKASSSSSSSQSYTAETLKNTVQWYEYPPFIIAMLLHQPSWAAWR
jgi:hypothetical protein